MNHDLKKRKIIVLGAPSVGKSSLIHRYSKQSFREAYLPTIQDSTSVTIEYNGVKYDCEILDTAGKDVHSLFNPSHVIGIHGYVLVYSTTSRKSFDLIKDLHEQIRDYSGKEDIRCVIVGSKVDLEESRQVQQSDGETLAQTNNAAWVETSAKMNLNVAKVFELCLAEIEKSNQVKPAAPINSCKIM